MAIKELKIKNKLVVPQFHRIVPVQWVMFFSNYKQIHNLKILIKNYKYILKVKKVHFVHYFYI